MKDKQRLFRIGEISKIYHLPVKTLRFYSDCGLLTPAYIDPSSGYRYYSIDQFVRIDIIRNSKRMNMSLEEIAEIMEHDLQASDIADVIEKQIDVMNQKIKEYEKMRDSMSVISQIIREAVAVQINTPYIGQESKQYYQSYPYQSTTPEEQEINFRKVALGSGEESEHVYSLYGVSTSADAYFKGEGIINPDIRNYMSDASTPNVCVQPAGEYACIVFDDNVYQKEQYYRRLTDFIQNENRKTIGDFTEEWIIPRIQDGKESTLIKLKIQVN
ncbi:transcriptional regulator, MerR family [Lachnospiraceae bacterium KM106-2]|nr:transcriptional regulator, MerR family [Lachnospiraceae bacterium KM106-2]